MGILSRIEIHGESNAWSAAERLKNNQGLDAKVGLE